MVTFRESCNRPTILHDTFIVDNNTDNNDGSGRSTNVRNLLGSSPMATRHDSVRTPEGRQEKYEETP